MEGSGLAKFEQLHTALLHDNTQYLQQTCDLINCEWKRSTTARLHSLNKSCPEFPTVLIVLGKAPHDKEFIVLGHSRLCKVSNDATGLLIESVVVSHKHRGQGLGRFVMEESEKFARLHGFSTMYLSTHDKEAFYKHLGYCVCSPIYCINGQMPNNLALQSIKSKFSSPNSQAQKESSKPHPPCRNPLCIKCKIWMKKEL